MIVIGLAPALVQLFDAMDSRTPIGHTLLPQTLIVLGAVALVILVAFVWVTFIRKPARRKRHHHHSHQSGRNGAARAAAAVEAVAKPHVRARRRKRRRWRRNPTLAETRGLPPLREDKPPTAN